MINSNNLTNKVTLWTRQNKKSLDELKDNGVIRISRKNLEEKYDIISDHVIYLYKWFVDAAKEIVPIVKGVEFPIWCSVSEEYMLRPTIDEVVYVLEVDKSDIIYFDGMKWDYVLNHHYIPKDEKDAIEYDNYIERKGFKNSYSFIDEKTAHFYHEERKKVMDSWKRIFEIDEWDIFKIQANIWEIRPEMIKDILYYEKK
ncbi:MAG: DUF3841 domain-containing protein [Tissierellia bacterium]|nr:DUF3841 domain-containing protein [Tissierellia bacterium]MDD4780285.1 DUF3841 domain-containing protein [Tissierellia bacterium]